MLYRFDPSWILYGVAVLAVIGLVRQMLREQSRQAHRDTGPFLLFPPPVASSHAQFRAAPEIEGAQWEWPKAQPAVLWPPTVPASPPAREPIAPAGRSQPAAAVQVAVPVAQQRPS